MTIRKAKESDIEGISKVYSECFPREKNHKLWIHSCHNSFPKSVYFVFEDENVIRGYILWSVKNGFREKTIIELEQLGVHPEAAGKGVGRQLIKDSFEGFKRHVKDMGLAVNSVLVTTSDGNFAEKLYKSTLGVERNGLINGYGSGDEVVLFNRSDSEI